MEENVEKHQRMRMCNDGQCTWCGDGCPIYGCLKRSESSDFASLSGFSFSTPLACMHLPPAIMDGNDTSRVGVQLKACDIS